jgi:asparagine synthase (glutamine-hydrolysing)
VLDFGYVPTPHSIYVGMSQLEPGQVLVLDDGKAPKTYFYWTLGDAKRSQLSRPHSTDQEQLETLDATLNAVIGRYLVADVPVGCFLSGGLDSSLIAAMAAQHSPRLKTFAIGFKESRWDESWKARAIAAHLRTEHYELILESRDALSLVEALCEHYDEPFADFSQLPTLAVSRLAREHVTVSLSGDGGDELFGGYDRYSWSQNFWALITALPEPHRTSVLDHLAENKLRIEMPATIAPAIEEVLVELPKKLPFGRAIRDFKDLYERIMRTGPISPFRPPCGFISEDHLEWDDDTRLTLTDRMQLADMRRYMADGILTKVDRASMSVGLEVRVPLLNERVVQQAFALPERAKFGPDGRRGLQTALAFRYVPRELVDHPKMGFGFPIDVWLRTSLRDWASDLLSPASLADVPYIDPASVAALWRAHLSEQSSEHWRLWPVLMFVQWHRRWRHHLQ